MRRQAFMQMFSSGSQSTVSPSLRSVKAEAEGRTSTSSKSPRTGNITVSSSWYPSSRRRNTSSPRLILQFALRIIVEQRYENSFARRVLRRKVLILPQPPSGRRRNPCAVFAA